MDWAPIPALRELRRIVNVMDKASKAILEKKRVEAKMGVLDREKVGKDVMTIMCTSLTPVCYSFSSD